MLIDYSRIYPVDSFQHELATVKSYLSKLDSRDNSIEKPTPKKHVFVDTKNSDDTLEFVSPEKNPFDRYQTEKKVHPDYDTNEIHRFSESSKLESSNL